MPCLVGHARFGTLDCHLVEVLLKILEGSLVCKSLVENVCFSFGESLVENARFQILMC